MSPADAKAAMAEQAHVSVEAIQLVGVWGYREKQEARKHEAA